MVGPGDRNEALRYSLRSLGNLDHDRVWIAGHLPSWVRGVRHIPVPQVSTRWENSTANMLAACEHPGVSGEFVYFNDDFFVMRETVDVPIWHLGPVDAAARRWGGSSYARGALRTRDRLAQLGHSEPVSYEVHAPMVVDKAAMRAALAAGAGVVPLHKRTMYGNLAGVGGVQVRDVKVATARAQPPEALFISTADAAFAGRAGGLIRAQFPRPGPYEHARGGRMDEIDQLRAEAASLGISVRQNARADTIRRKIDEHLAEAAADQSDDVVADEPEPVEQRNPVVPPPAPAPTPVGRRRAWVNAEGRRKTTRVGSGLDHWYDASEHWKPA